MFDYLLIVTQKATNRTKEFYINSFKDFFSFLLGYGKGGKTDILEMDNLNC